MPDTLKIYSVRRPWVAFVAGALIGLLGGLIGLGGAEFRLPVLISLFALLPHRAVRFNLLVSLVTLLFAFAGRAAAQTGMDVSSHADVLLSIIAGGLVSAWIGAGALARVPPHRLMQVMAGLLALIAITLLGEAAMPDNASRLLAPGPQVSVAAGIVAGLFIGAVSSLLGVAGGEFIIPVLIFVFGVDIKAAGSLSLLISLPIVAVGVARHRLTGHYRSRDVLLHLVLPMSLGSIFGALAGGRMAAEVDAGALKAVLAVILAVSAFKLARKAARS